MFRNGAKVYDHLEPEAKSAETKKTKIFGGTAYRLEDDDGTVQTTPQAISVSKKKKNKVKSMIQLRSVFCYYVLLYLTEFTGSGLKKYG